MGTGNFALSHPADGVSDIYGLFSEPVVVLSAENDLRHAHSLSPQEAAVVSGAVDKRKREFGTGRFLARCALSRFGCAPVDLPHGPGGAPIWPEGFRGSISHCDTRAVVAVAESANSGSLGIDIEHRAQLQRELWPRILLPEEIAELEREVEESERGVRALLTFSAKEAFYKAQYVWTTKFLDFHAVHVRFEPPAGEALQGDFECTLQLDVPPFAASSTVRGRYRLAGFPGGELITALHLPDPGSRSSF